MNTVLHYPDGTEQTLETDDYMMVIGSLDSNVKVVDTWQKGNSNHFELGYKSVEELLTEENQ